ncbi:MAG: hypothetical protein ABII26_01380 [Pseudomonadota bacterium]
MKIGIPIWGDRLSPVMDTASRLLIVETDGHKEASRFETYLEVQDLPSRCFRIHGLGLDVLICGAISRPFLRRLMSLGINIIHGISGHPADVLDAYLQGSLHDSRFLMPGFTGNGLGETNMSASLRRRRRKKGKAKKDDVSEKNKAKDNAKIF